MAMLAQTDALTGLLNRRGFLEQAHRLAEQEPDIALILFDLDHFKSVNDRFGHDVGDQLLHRVGEVLRTGVRDAIVGRLGGEEFGVVAALDLNAGWALAERIRQAVAAIELRSNGKTVACTASLGLAVQRSMPFGTLYHAADQALYAAKSAGRNTTIVAN
jgi:diguanylate cyclase (GGDEF)-like protein